MKQTTNNPQKPWYKQPLVWLVISIPATSVVLGLSLLTLAINTDDSLVYDDYYKQGKQINRRLERDQYAAALGLSATLTLNTIQKLIHVKLHSKLKIKATKLHLRFSHPTRNKQDLDLVLKSTGVSQQYIANLPALRNGYWYVQVESQRWRLKARIHLPSSSAIILQATP